MAHEDRETKFTDQEFDDLERNEDGRIVDDFPMSWIWMTDDQKARLHGDDISYGDDCDEEMHCMIAEFM